MEQITETMGRIDVRTPKSSEIQQSRSNQNTPTDEVALTLVALINRARALNGWKMQDYNTLKKRMLVWWDVLKQYRIPVQHYKELFDMAFDERQLKISAGKDVPIEAALLVSCWTRPHGLKARIEQRLIDEGRTLTSSAQTQCDRCFGTGIEYAFDIDGSPLGAKPGTSCDHRPFEPGEAMFKQKQAVRDAAVVAFPQVQEQQS